MSREQDRKGTKLNKIHVFHTWVHHISRFTGLVHKTCTYHMCACHAIVYVLRTGAYQTLKAMHNLIIAWHRYAGEDLESLCEFLM